MAKYNYNDSLLELAVKIMQEAPEGLTLSKVFEKIKAIKYMSETDAKELAAGFYVDFMLSGYFVVVKSEKGEKVWNLKERVEIDLLNNTVAQIVNEEEDAEAEENQLNEKNAKRSIKANESDDDDDNVINPDAITALDNDKTTDDDDDDTNTDDDDDNDSDNDVDAIEDALKDAE